MRSKTYPCAADARPSRLFVLIAGNRNSRNPINRRPGRPQSQDSTSILAAQPIRVWIVGCTRSVSDVSRSSPATLSNTAFSSTICNPECVSHSHASSASSIPTRCSNIGSPCRCQSPSRSSGESRPSSRPILTSRERRTLREVELSLTTAKPALSQTRSVFEAVRGEVTGRGVSWSGYSNSNLFEREDTQLS